MDSAISFENFTSAGIFIDTEPDCLIKSRHDVRTELVGEKVVVIMNEHQPTNQLVQAVRLNYIRLIHQSIKAIKDLSGHDECGKGKLKKKAKKARQPRQRNKKTLWEKR
eukprot:scaffold6907_cov128-Skeletonema_dohrnii-CCMP3373.AAC.7